MNRKLPPVVEPVETTFKMISTILFLSLFLISCKSTDVTKPVEKKITATGLRPIYVTNSKKIELLLPEYAEGYIDTFRVFDGNFGNTSFSLLSYTQIDKTGISISLMNDFGTDMGNVSYDGSKVVFDSAYFPKNLPGEYIVCDIQNAFYDSAALKENYNNAGLTFEETLILLETGTPEEIRKIYDGEKLIEEISNHDDTISIINYLRGYEYILTKVEE